MASDPTVQDPTLGHGPIGPETDIATICVHGGYPHEGDGTTARAAPLHRTTSYQFKSVEHAADLFALSELGNIYTRLGNPTTDILEKRLALMHGGPEMGGLAMASGTVAIFQAITNIAEAGDNIVSANNLYGGTMTMFEHILPKMGITCTFVDPKDPSSFLSVRPPRHRPFLAPLALPLTRNGGREWTRTREHSSARPAPTPPSTSRISKPSPTWPTTTACPSLSTIPSRPHTCSGRLITASMSSARP